MDSNLKGVTEFEVPNGNKKGSIPDWNMGNAIFIISMLPIKAETILSIFVL
jgi:hypothetical protein